MNLQALPEEALKEILALTEAKKTLDLREKAHDQFMPFAHHVYENFIEGRHHRVIAEKLERVARGELKRLIINMPPRHSKSEFASYLMPAWFLGRNPKLKIIQATHNTELAVRFGRKVRDLIDDPAYKSVFPDTNLKEDNKGAGRWQTDRGGEYFAAGVGAAVTGRGADLFVIDDPHSEQDAMSESAFENAYEWYTSGPRQRLQPGGAIIIVMTRWGKKDLTGRLIAAQGGDVMADKWEVVEFPAIMPSDKPLWPEFWEKDALLGIKASLPVAKWNAQWQQQPTSSESAIIKREWWKDWEKEKTPQLDYIIQATHNTELAVRFGRKVRDLIDDPAYKSVFPDTNLKEDNKGAGRWQTDRGGEYFAAGVGAAVTGRGADLFVIDDPHSEQDAMSESAFENAYEWYTSGPRQRLQPGGAIIIVMTRWGKKDLTGRLIAAQGGDVMADKWEVVEFPAIMPSDKPLWPEFWEKDALLGIKASLPVAKWNAQWQQQPTSSESAIIKREWWKDWEKEKTPQLDYIIQAYDTAFSKKETADYSAITTWGIFKPEEGGADHAILMDARRGRWNFPELKEIAYEEHEYWEPDMVLVEAKATGTPLIDELRLRGIPALGFSPGKGNDKVTRMHMVAPLFEAGMVWAPMHEKFADEVVEEVVSFPNGDHDDFCDSMTLALMRFRQGGFISLSGEDEDSLEWRPRKREYY